MKKTVSTIAVVAISMAVSTAAAGLSQDGIPYLQRPTAGSAPSITLTGCVARGTTSGSYTLAEEKKAEATTPDVATPAALVTLAGTDVDMSKHVGHKVEITGAYANADVVAGTTGTDRPAAPATTEGGKKAAKTFTVQSLKMVAGSC